MLTRREEEIVILENEEKNDEILMEWVQGKEGKRDGSNSKRGQQEGPKGSPTAVPTGTPTEEGTGTPTAEATKNAPV